MINDPAKIAIVKKELLELMDMARPFLSLPEVEEMYDRLLIVNKSLWDIEDELRKLEADKKFDEEFIGKARSVYHLNDRRYQIKNEINLKTGSNIGEVKQYVEY